VSVRCSPRSTGRVQSCSCNGSCPSTAEMGACELDSTQTNQFGPQIRRFWVMTVNWAITTASKRDTTNWTEWATVRQSPSPLPSKILNTLRAAEDFFHGAVPAIQSPTSRLRSTCKCCVPTSWPKSTSRCLFYGKKKETHCDHRRSDARLHRFVQSDGDGS
jgi:hypothetical protein